MPEATARCPGCGAPAAANSARCEYCGSALATVTCPSCFAPMFVGSRFCTRCGAEVKRADLDDGEALPCPRCKEDLHAIGLGSTAVHECSACGGLWVDPESLQKLCNARDEHAAVVSALAARVPTAQVAPDTVKYVPCPKCKKFMNRVNFAKTSGVVMDVCKADGVWLDRGELQRVIDFVEHGGLEASRARERERLVYEQQRLASMQQAASAGVPQVTFTASRNAPDTPLDRLLQDAIGLFLK
jgi:Zn-finger nucleic acid-binding protein